MRQFFASLAVAAAFAPAMVSAQSVESMAAAAPAPVVMSGAMSSASAVSPAMVRPDVAGIRVASDANTPLEVNAMAAQGLHKGQGVALMAVGGVGLVAGLLIGDDAGTAVAIGGLAVGLVGLYEYVR